LNLKARQTISPMVESIYTYTSRFWTIDYYGPEFISFMRIATIIVLTVTPVFLLINVVYALIVGFNILLFILSVAPVVVLVVAPYFWRFIVKSGVDKELPAVLAYLMVYTKSPIHIADLIVKLKDERGFFWFRFESSRLKFLLDSGLDPLAALKKLAETTPSKSFSSVLRDYTNAQILGASRSQLSLILFNHALNSIREQWRAHIDFGKIVAEGIIAAIVSLIALTPVVLIGGSLSVLILVVPLVVAPAGALAMLATRPSLGEYKLGYFETLITLAVPFTAVLINFKVSLEAGLAYLIGMTIVVESIAIGYRNLSHRAFQELRIAIDEAKLGYIPEERLSRAERAAIGVIRAIISASRVAGTMGLSDALTQLYSLIDEARREAKSASVQASILALISIASVPMAIYSLQLLASAIQSMPQLGNVSSINEITTIIASTAPLVALPASVLQRGWLITPVYPLLAQILVLLIL